MGCHDEMKRKSDLKGIEMKQNKGITKEELQRYLEEKTEEIMMKENEIRDLHNRSYLLEGEAFGKGYRQAMNDVFDVIKEVFGKGNENEQG